MAFEKYNIRQFMAAWFNEDYSFISKKEFDLCYNEYLDSTGLYLSETFEKVAYIHFTLNRINTVKIWIDTQRKFVTEFGIPYTPSFDMVLDEFGYLVNWKDEADFEMQLKRIEAEESMFYSEYEIACKELDDLKKQTKQVPQTKKEQREGFIRTVNSLGKMGFRIDNDSTTVEELSIMIKQQMEEVNNG